MFSVLQLIVGCASESHESGSNQASAVWFRDIAPTAGVDFKFESGFGDRPLLPEIVGGGVAIADFNGDTHLDLYFVQAGFNLDEGQPADLALVPPNVMYFGDGSMHFEEATAIGDAVDRGYGMGAYAGDYDRDGDVDIYVTNVGSNALLRNDGSGRFVNVTEFAGVDDSGWSTAGTFADFDNDGWLDLFITNYIHWSPAAEMACYSRGAPTYCLPTGYQAEARDRLFRNNTDGTFTDVTNDAGLAAAYGPGLGLVTVDFNGDGLLDVFVANDTMVNQLWLNQGNFKFVNEAVYWGSAVDDHGFAKAGMGIDSADINRDGQFDVIVVNFEGQTDSVFLNEGSYFRDITSKVGLGTGSRQFTRFGVVFGDFDNDGVIDIYEANGKVDGVAASLDDPFAEPNMLMRGQIQDGFVEFVDVSDRLASNTSQIHTSRGVAMADLDRDGRLDLVVGNRDAPAYLLHNQVADLGNWISLELRDKNGAIAIGAVAQVRSADDSVVTGVAKTSGSFLASNSPSVQIGLGEINNIERIDVKWLGKDENESFVGASANACFVLIEGTGSAKSC